MNCIYHPQQAATADCILCNNPICSDCRKEIEGKSYCYNCATKIPQFSKAYKERKWWSCWLKGCAIGCGVLVLILIIILVFIWVNRERIREGMGKMISTVQVESIKVVKNEVIANLPNGFNEQEVRKVFDALEEMARNNQFSFADFGRFMNEYNQALKDKELDEYELRRILNEAKRITGSGSKE